MSDFLWTYGTCHSKSFNGVRDSTIIINYFKIIIIITILVIDCLLAVTSLKLGRICKIGMNNCVQEMLLGSD